MTQHRFGYEAVDRSQLAAFTAEVQEGPITLTFRTTEPQGGNVSKGGRASLELSSISGDYGIVVTEAGPDSAVTVRIDVYGDWELESLAPVLE